jgi:hypothetical protein
MAAAYGFWPDLTTAWAFGELLLERQRYQDALVLFQKAAAAKSSAIRFDTVAIWVRSLAMAAVCLDATGRTAEAAPYWGQFQKLWGSPSQYAFVRRVTSKATHQQ